MLNGSMEAGLLRTTVAAVLLALLAGPALSEERSVWIIGVGGLSCASWMANPSMETEGSAWILGFWSGANMAKSAGVGRSTDGAGIVERVKRACRDDPSLLLTKATSDLYLSFRDEGR
jgi:hypothetical protein